MRVTSNVRDVNNGFKPFLVWCPPAYGGKFKPIIKSKELSEAFYLLNMRSTVSFWDI